MGFVVPTEMATSCLSVLPSASPVVLSSAANRGKVPLRLSWTAWRWARPGDSGSVRSSRSRAWIDVLGHRHAGRAARSHDTKPASPCA